MSVKDDIMIVYKTGDGVFVNVLSGMNQLGNIIRFKTETSSDQRDLNRMTE